MANTQHVQFSDENGDIYYLENQTEDVRDTSGKPLSNGGDLSEASVKFTADTTRKLPQSGGRFKAFLGSIVKYLSDLGAAAFMSVANNDTTNRSDMLSTAQVAYQHGKEIDQLNSEIQEMPSEIWHMITDSNGTMHFNDIYLCNDKIYIYVSDNGYLTIRVPNNNGYVYFGFHPDGIYLDGSKICP